MPRGDRSGPDGMGPMTGRALGYCSGYDSPGFTRAAFGRRGGFGRGFGRGMEFARRPGRFYDPYPRYSEADELQILKEESKRLSEDLESIKARIKEIEKS